MFMYPYSITLSNVSYAIEALIPRLALNPAARSPMQVIGVVFKFVKNHELRALAQKFSTAP